MIIADLNHFEKVVSQASSIIGGATTTQTTNKLPEDILDDFSDDISTKLEVLTGTVKSVQITSQNSFSKSTTATLKKGSQTAKVSASQSAVTAEKK